MPFKPRLVKSQITEITRPRITTAPKQISDHLETDRSSLIMRMLDVLKIFSLDVLDTRLGPPNDEKKKQQIVAKAGPVRWRTKEFYVYGLVFAICVPLMFKAGVEASSSSNINYPKYEDRLQQGWMFGRKLDNSDLQYSAFRNNLPYLTLAIVIHFILRRIANFLSIPRSKFDLAFAALFLSAIHGLNSLKILLLVGINFTISRKLSGKTAYIASWVFGVTILFANELFQGYPLGYIHPELEFLDSYAGLISRWDVHFNFTMLRMISYNVDYFQALAKIESDAVNKTDKEIKEVRTNVNNKAVNQTLTLKKPEVELTERQRIETPPPIEDFSFQNYLAYLLYTPLYLAGPILTFNDFIYQNKKALPSISFNRIALYTIRLCFCILVMETILHYMYVVAISQTRAWDGDSPFQISMIAFFNLNVIWLKLLIPWRLFRLWALLDGIDPPENMIRCVNNNYSAMSFWRAWHRSYNKWIIRYIYIPLGGAKHPIVNSLIVFSFVAIWHDIQLRLLVWGWMVVFFIVPEIVASLVFKKFSGKPFYRHLSAIGAVANIWMMMIANLVGFCVGLDGIKQMLTDMTQTAQGLIYVITCSCALFVGVQAMFEFRATEMRQGINLRC